MTVTIEGRYNGPPASANGGYACGVLAAYVDGPAEVTLRRPPPLDRPLRVERDGDGVFLLDGGELVAEGRPAELDLAVPAGVSFDEAQRASAGYVGFTEHPFPTCFVCGPARDDGDGLRIFPGPVEGRELVAAPWVAGAPRPELVWAVLDCPGAFAVEERGERVLGRLVARVDRVPERGERCVVLGWPLGAEGRKHYAGTAVLGADGEPLARGRATWFALA